MPLVYKTSKQKIEQPVEYKVPTADEQYKLVQWLRDKFVFYVEQQTVYIGEAKIDFAVLGEIVVRIDKRKEYFSIYHSTERINDVKEAALFAYWILKFRPFSMPDESNSERTTQLNEGFAAFLLFSAVKEDCRKNHRAFHVSEGYISRLMYGLRYWDLSKESMMLIAETLCESIAG